MHGDIFYPTAWLRLILPTAFAMDLGFVLHYILAGFFAFLFLRRIKVTWAGAVVGGLGYQLSGVVASYVHPGHDGKLYVTALLPLALMSLYMAIKERKREGFGLLALTVGLAILSPHPQMAQYMLIVAGIFTLFLVFGESSQQGTAGRLADLSLALVAVVLGVFISAVQMLPFWEYIPFSPRAETYRGFEDAVSYAIPWHHVPEFFLSSFVGQSSAGTYWGSNPIKLHSEYLGLALIALALLGVTSRGRRRMILWLGGIGLLFLLVALGGATPFYRLLWYEFVPFVKQTRAPGMALYILAFIVATYAAFGSERLEKGEGTQFAVGCLAAGGVVALFSLAGIFGGIAVMLAQGIDQSTGTQVARIATGAAESIRWGAFGSGVALAALGGLAYAALRGKVTAAVLSLGLVFLVSGDLWRNARSFWVFSDPQAVHAPDPLIELVTATEQPYRVFNDFDYVYGGSSLMTHGISQLLGHHGNELHRFDVLLGERNVWQHRGYGIIWDLFAIEWAIIAAGHAPDSLPGFDLVLENHQTWNGLAANLYRRSEPAQYARLVPGAVKVPDEQAVAAVLDPRFSPNRVVLLDPSAPVNPTPLEEIPEAVPPSVTITSWQPGRMTLHIDPAVEQDTYLMVAENWYPDWHATVDGETAPVTRGNQTLITVPVAAGATEVELWFDSGHHRVGKVIAIVSLLLTATAIVVPVVLRRRSGV
jgi:hypothetical protein